MTKPMFSCPVVQIQVRYIISKSDITSQKTNEVSQRSARGVKTILNDVANFASNAKYGQLGTKMTKNSLFCTEAGLD